MLANLNIQFWRKIWFSIPSIEKLTTRFENTCQQIQDSIRIIEAHLGGTEDINFYKNPTIYNLNKVHNIVEVNEITFYRPWNIIIIAFQSLRNKIKKQKMKNVQSRYCCKGAFILLLLPANVWFLSHHLFHNTIPFFSNIFVGLFYNLQFALLQCYIFQIFSFIYIN